MRKAVFLILPLCITFLLFFPILFSHSGNIVGLYILESPYSAISGASNGHILINMTYPEPKYQIAAAVIQREDGGFILGGYDGNAVDGGQMLLGADAAGNYEWNVSICPSSSVRRLAMCKDGGFALLGDTWPEGSEYYDWFLSRVNGTLDHQWNQTYGGAGDDYPSGIVELEDGFMIGGTYTNVSGADFDYMLIRTDIIGTQLWNVTFGDSEDQRCTQMIQCIDGSFLLCGFAYTSSLWDIWLVKADSSGMLLWNHTYSTPLYDMAYDVVTLQDGGYAVAGSISTGYEADMLLLRIDSEGNQLWNRTFSRGANQEFMGYSLIVTPDRGFCLRGRNGGPEPSYVFWLVRTDKNGNILWEYQLGQETVYVYSVINAKGGGFVTVGMAGEYGTEEWDFHLMLFPELSWNEQPADQLWFTNVIPIPTYQLNATSAAPIQSWQVNDTHFDIDNQGLLTNATYLNGTYYLHITVTDSVDNILTADIIIQATMKTWPTTTITTNQPVFPVELLAVASIGAAVLMVTVVYLAKTKKR